MTGGSPVEPPVYRPFALLAFASVLLLGAPLGVWMALGGAPAQVVWLHAAVQLFGFFGTLIVGVAHHLLARFTGRPTGATALTPWLLAGLAAALALRVAGVAFSPSLTLAGAPLHALVFTAFAVWVWRAIDPPPLRPLRARLALASAWLAAAAALETWLRARGGGVPDAAGMQVVYAMAVVGGVLGWVLGVLLRAGPMFVRDWRVPPALVHVTPWALGLSVALHAAASFAVESVALASMLARAGDAVAWATLAAVIPAAGALRRSHGAPPMLSRSLPESRIFRVAVASALAGCGLALWALYLGPEAPRILTDAVRHLLAIGMIGAVVIAMTFRLIPALERRRLPWPVLRTVALWSLVGAVALRTGQVLTLFVPFDVTPVTAASGMLAWIAFGSAGSNLIAVRPTSATSRSADR
jgi:NnrS protein